MKNTLLTSDKNFFKGNMHCHSIYSDGKLTPEELKNLFKSNGYSFLAITDHENVYNHSYLDDEDFVTITSTELSIKEFPEQSSLSNFKMKVCHLNLYAKKQDNNLTVCYNKLYDHYNKCESKPVTRKLTEHYDRIYSSEGINDIIKIANDNGFFVAYNHPRWSLENYAQYSKYEGLWGLEVINGAVHTSGLYDYNINVHDDFLRDGKRIFISAGDDNHNQSRNDACYAFVCVNTEKPLSYDAVIDSLLKGDFYTSTGPKIEELYVEDGKVHVKSSKAKAIYLTTVGRRHANKTAPEGSYITEAEFNIFPLDEYFRISVLDEHGNRADSQAYFISELN